MEDHADAHLPDYAGYQGAWQPKVSDLSHSIQLSRQVHRLAPSCFISEQLDDDAASRNGGCCCFPLLWTCRAQRLSRTIPLLFSFLKIGLVFHMEVGLPLQDAEAGRGGVSPDVSPDAAAAASLKIGNGSP